MKSPFYRVVKVGGSLFDLPDLGVRLLAWLVQQSPATDVLVAGGGAAVDQIRSEPAYQNLNEHDAHWRCVEIMSDTVGELSKLMPSALVQSHIKFKPSHSPTIFLTENWLKNVEPLAVGTRLPESWDVTSDSIAARLAICTDADELVLLKSADPPSHDLQQLADLGFVDKFLPQLAGELPPWRIVNLRQL